MIKNYIKTTFRNIVRNKIFSLINILGLSIGMACAILILLWIQDELCYDKFHENAENIYLVVRGDTEGPTAVTSKMLTTGLKEEIPEITNTTNFLSFPEGIKFLLSKGNKVFEENILFAGPDFFKMFSFSFTKGNPNTVLSNPNSIVLTEEASRKYFGDKYAVGNTLEISVFGKVISVEVTGILKNIPNQSHIQNQIYMPSSGLKLIGINYDHWGDQSFHTYVQLKKNCDLQEISSKLKQYEIRNYSDQFSESLTYSLLPLTDIHLYGSNIRFLDAKGDITYVKIFAIVAVFILLIGSINYMNLSAALSFKRTREIGIKKTLGAGRKSLILQFLGESFILSIIAFLFSLIIIEIFLPEFNVLSGKQLAINFFDSHFILLSFIIVVFTSIIAGCYPALLMASFKPAQILKGKHKMNLIGLLTRKGLVVFQFTISIVIILCTVVVFSQLSFIVNSNLGFDKENILCISISGDANAKYDVLKNEMLKNPEVKSVSRSEPVNIFLTRTTSVNWQQKDENEEKHFWILHTDFDLADTYKFQVKQGRFFSKQYSTDATSAFVVNEAAVKSMGLKSPINSEIQLWGKRGKIIGVIKDFHFDSFRSKIEPLIFSIPGVSQSSRYGVISIRYKSNNLENLLSFLKETWQANINNTPFTYNFYDDSLNKQYQAEIRMGSIFKYFSFISILIACLGLFGLTALVVEQRKKEVGIRKILGASISSVTIILSKEFLLLVLVSNIVAFPVAWYLMNNWLGDFAYRIDMSLWMFVLSGGIALGIALATVSYQAIKAATANPIKALKYE